MNKYKQLLKSAKNSNKIIPGFNVFTFQTAIAVSKAAQRAGAPIMLLTNGRALEAFGIKKWGLLLNEIKKEVDTDIILGLDHVHDKNIVIEGIKYGYDFVMCDGSQFPIDENIKFTKEIQKITRCNDILLEAEIGSVGYSDCNDTEYKPALTVPEEARIFLENTNIDLMAISIGTVHKQAFTHPEIRYDLLLEIEKKCYDTPLVIHGFSGVKKEDILKLKRSNIAKVNIGTLIRKAYTSSFRKEIKNNPQEIDDLFFVTKAMMNVENEVYKIIKMLWDD